MNEQLVRAPVLWLTRRSWFRAMSIRSRMAARFVAGDGIWDAMEVASELGRHGIGAMFDHLGENVTTEEGAAEAASAYAEAASAILDSPGLDCGISVKLTQLGLDLSYDLCRENLEGVLAAAAGTLVMIDMESHRYVDPTLRLYRGLRGGYERFGVCLQSYLRRTASDVFDLPERSIVRLVKGAYLEPHEVAFSGKAEVDSSFRRLFATLLARGHAVHVATHDQRLVRGARSLAGRAVGFDRGTLDRVEFQMLYGIRRDLQESLARDGCPVRVYVPYGTEWYPYLTRRLAERPANLWFFATNLVRRGR